MASFTQKRLPKEELNFLRFVKICTYVIKLPLIDLLTSAIQPIHLYTKIKSSRPLTNGKSTLQPHQLKICFLPPPSLPDYSKFDVTLLYTLIRNLCPSLKPTQGWGEKPQDANTMIGDDIERLRLFRNICMHDSTSISDSDFEDLWQRLKVVLLRIENYMTSKSKGCYPNYAETLTYIKQLDLGDENIEELKKMYILECLYDKEEQRKNGQATSLPTISISGSEKVLIGDTARFKAIVSPGNSNGWLVMWNKKNGDISKHIDLSKNKYNKSTDRELIIQPVCSEDEGVYQAYLVNGSNVKVDGNVLFLETMGDLPVFDNWEVTTGIKRINIHYKVKENIPYVDEINWTKDGDTLTCNNRSRKYNGGGLKDSYLTIISPTTEDRGTYKCMVKNAVGTEHREVKIDFPHVQIPSTGFVYFGRKTELSPTILSCPSLDGIEWQKSSDGETFSNIDLREPKHFGSSHDPVSPLLVILNVNFEDKLYYRLLAWNKIGEKYSNTIYLNVTGSPPNIVVSHRTFIENKSVQLIANVFLYEQCYAVQDVYWTQNGEKIEIHGSGGKYSKVTNHNPSLTIFEVNEFDAGTYHLIATNVVGSTKSDGIILGRPDVFLRKHGNTENEGRYFTVVIESIPAPWSALWYTQTKEDERLHLIDVNAEEYRGSTNCLPSPMLVLHRKDQLEKNCFTIKVTNFVGTTVLEVNSGGNHSAVDDKKVVLEKKPYRNSEADIRFAKLCNYLARHFPPEEFENLKHVLRSSEKVQNVPLLMDANSVWACLKILQDERLFTREDVTLMQWLCTETGCEALNTKCIDYAKKQGAIFFSEKEPEEGYTNVPFHVQGDLTDYTKEDIQNIVRTVAAMVDCVEKDIVVNGVLHSTSFILILSMRKSVTQKLSALNEQDCLKLQKLKIDSLSLNGKTITLESVKEPKDNDAKINEKETFKQDDQEKNTKSDESHSTERDYTSVENLEKRVVRRLQEGKTCLLKLMPDPEVRKMFTLTEFNRCSHISYANLDRLYINEGIKLIMSNTSGETLHYFENIRNDPHAGSHTVSRNDELFYIDPKYHIVRMSDNGWKTKSTFIKCVEETDSTWRPWCIYYSLLTEDLLVGMKQYDRLKGRVIRYNNIGEKTQEIQHDEMGCDIYSSPRFITENHNGDVVVSDSTGTVVVTDHEGRHRFSYKGHSPESQLSPLGICTDPMSHILVCDELTHAVQMLDKDGHFLSNLLIKPSDIVSPSCLCYDFKADLLWVGSNVNYSVCIYKYLTTQRSTNRESEIFGWNKEELSG